MDALKNYLRLWLFVLFSTMTLSSSLVAEDLDVSSIAINVNTADVTTLASELTGVGEKKAEAIVAYREAHGPFKDADQLLAVKGIGQATIDKNRDRIKFSD